MAKKKDKDEDFTKGIMVRIYDLSLAERLREEYGKANYDSKSGYLTELIQSGLSAREQCETRQKEIASSSESILAELKNIASKLNTIESTMYNQFQFSHNKRDVLQKLLSATYAICETINAGQYVSQEELEKGFYDYLPNRLIGVKI